MFNKNLYFQIFEIFFRYQLDHFTIHILGFFLEFQTYYMMRRENLNIQSNTEKQSLM